MQEAQAPSGQVPQYLVVSEIQRRTDMRKRYQEQQQPQGTVADQIVQEAAGGIASMPPQGMPPQGVPPQGMPPQGMPPQGAPQQAMPPQAMPPQQMFSGGIIRLQEGGFLDQQTVSRAGDVRSQIERAIAEGASMSDLLAIFRNQPEAIELVKQLVADRQRASVSQYNPLSDEGAVNAYRSIPSMDDLVSSFRDMAPERGQEIPDLAGRYAEQVASIKESLPSLPEGAGSNFPEMFQSGRDVNAQLASLPSLPEGAGSNFPETFQSGRDTNTQLASLPEGAASVFDVVFGVPERPDYEVAGEVATYRPFDQEAAKPGQVDAPEALKDALELAQEGTSDASREGVGALYDDGGIERLLRGSGDTNRSGAKNVQGDSPIQTQALSGDKTEPGLDFADLIADAKKAGMANALMQLGAGIAGGDLSKGISAAGVAATKGQQAAKDMAIKQRLATYAAGREDAARDEQKRQFGLELGLKEDQYGKSLLQTSLSSIPNMIRQKELELANLRSTLPDDDPRITAIIEEIKSLTNQYNTFIARAEAEINDFKDYKVLGTTGA